MATENRLWGAERIRGELLKLGHAVAKSTIQRYMSQVRSTAPEGQRWLTFLRNQARGIWCCDLFEVITSTGWRRDRSHAVVSTRMGESASTGSTFVACHGE
jgi:hypothetical protein